MPLTNEFLPHHPLVFSAAGCWDAEMFKIVSSALDRQTGSSIINPVGNGGFSSKLRWEEVLKMLMIMHIMKEVTPHYSDGLADNWLMWLVNVFDGAFLKLRPDSWGRTVKTSSVATAVTGWLEWTLNPPAWLSLRQVFPWFLTMKRISDDDLAWQCTYRRYCLLWKTHDPFLHAYARHM